MSMLDALPAGLRGVDAFTVLGLAYDPDLTDEQVRTAYLLRLRAVHPDTGGDVDAAAAVTAAYDALRSGVRHGELLAAVTVERESAPIPVPPGAGWWWARAGSPPPGQADAGARPGTGRVPGAARREELWRKMSAARVEQGLPPYITDEATLDKIADLLVGTLGQDERGKAAPAPAGAAASRQMAGRGGLGAGPVAGPWLVRGWLRLRHGRPWWLAARVMIAAALVIVAQVAAPGDPAVWALAVGAATWLARTGRFDLGPRTRR